MKFCHYLAMVVVMVTPKDDYSTTDYDGDYGLATK